MQFATQLKRARITYAVIMASVTCIIMSAVSTSILVPAHEFWRHWPPVLLIDLCVAIPVAIALGPIVRRLCSFIYPDLSK
jgi:hypothetical protein